MMDDLMQRTAGVVALSTLLGVAGFGAGARPAAAQHVWRHADGATAPSDDAVEEQRAAPGSSKLDRAGFAGVEDPPAFLRVSSDPGNSVALQIAARRYEHVDPDQPELVLVGVSHIGDARYYEDLQQLLDEFDVVLYESVKPAGTGGPPPGAAHLETPEERAERTRAGLGFLASVVESYHAHHDRYPEDFDDLHAFARQRDSRLGEFVDQASRDAWDRPIAYALDPRHDGTRAYLLTSLGADGQPGGRGADADLSTEELGVIAPQASGSSGDGIQGQLALALGLEFQLNAIDYAAPNWRCSDMSIDQVQRAMAKRGTDFSIVEGTLAGSSLPAQIAQFLLGAVRVADTFTQGAMSDTLKVVLIEMLGDEATIAMSLDQFDEGFAEVIIGERNQVVIDDLERLMRDEPKIESVGVFYGAGHMRDLTERLASLGYRPAEAEWLSAIEVDLNTSVVSEREVRYMRQTVQRMMRQMRNMR